VAAINKYVKETSRMHAEVHELHNSPRIFQNNRCSACAATLELPASHFLCMHSFHQRCVGELDTNCARCVNANHTVMNIRRSLISASHDQDKFFQALDSSDDGFALMIEHLGRGLLDVP